MLDLGNRENTLSYLNTVLITATLLLTISVDVSNSVTKGELVEANNVCSTENADRQFWSSISVSIVCDCVLTVWSIILIAIYSTTSKKYLDIFSNEMHGILFFLLLSSILAFWMVGIAFGLKVCYVVEDKSRYDNFYNVMVGSSGICVIGIIYLAYKYYYLIYVPSRMRETNASSDNDTL